MPWAAGRVHFTWAGSGRQPWTAAGTATSPRSTHDMRQCVKQSEQGSSARLYLVRSSRLVLPAKQHLKHRPNQRYRQHGATQPCGKHMPRYGVSNSSCSSCDCLTSSLARKLHGTPPEPVRATLTEWLTLVSDGRGKSWHASELACMVCGCADEHGPCCGASLVMCLRPGMDWMHG